MADLIMLQNASVFTIAEDDDAIGDLLDLAQAMRNVDNAHALRPKLFDNLQKPLGFRQSKARCRLVHDEDACIERQGFRYLDHLLLGNRQLAERRPARNVKSEAFKVYFRGRIKLFAVDQNPK